MTKEESCIYYLFKNKFNEEWMDKQALCAITELRCFLQKELAAIEKVYARWQDD